jgi:ABC-type Zn uptake system ZnuABC Zn-binding protein ZnuA
MRASRGIAVLACLAGIWAAGAWVAGALAADASAGGARAERAQQSRPLRTAQAPPAQPAQPRADSEVLVLTALPVTYSIATALAEETRIRVVNVPVDGRPMSTQARFFERPSEEVTTQLRRADAVITIGKLWRADPLYAAARGQNIRVVNIDATEPVSTTLTGVALTREPDGRAPWETPGAPTTATATATAPPDTRPSSFFWLGPSNTARAAEIVAQDLARLSPQDAPKVMQNLAMYRRILFELKQSYEARLAELDDVTVFSLAPDFVYLTTDLGVLVDGYFLKQEIEWTPADFDAFTQHLKSRGIRVVIHKRDPDDAVRKAIAAAGAKLVVLRTAETFSTEQPRPSREQSYIQDLETNLRALHTALSK